MSLLQMNTALPLAEPLLEQQQQQQEKQWQQQQEDVDNKDSMAVQSELKSRIKFVLLGALTGFFVQMISLGAYAFILVHFNGMSLQDSGVLSMDGSIKKYYYLGGDDDNTVLYIFLSVLTQLDLVVYVLIWVGFMCTMTRSGMNCIRSQFFSSSSSDDDDNENENDDDDGVVVPRRYVFVLWVCFLVGIVVGAFTAWTAIDVYFEIPLGPVLATVLMDLALCYMMIKCYDMGGVRNNNNNSSSHNTNNKSTQTVEDEEDGIQSYC